MTFFTQIPGDHYQRLQLGVVILLLHLGDISGFFYKVVHTGQTNGELNTMKTQAPGAANRPPISLEWEISLYLCPAQH